MGKPNNGNKYCIGEDRMDTSITRDKGFQVEEARETGTDGAAGLPPAERPKRSPREAREKASRAEGLPKKSPTEVR